MLKIVYLITLFAVGFSTLDVDGFRDILESVPNENVGFAPVPYLAYSLSHGDREQQVKTCAKICRKSEFFCNSFVVLANKEDTREDIEENSKEDFEVDFESYSDEDIEGDIEGNTEENVEEDSEEITEEDIEEGDFDENIERNTEEDIEEDIEENFEWNFEEGSEDYIEEDVQCRIFPTVGSIFKHSQDNRNSIIAVYERESLPTAHELSRRFSRSLSGDQGRDLSEKYYLVKEIEGIAPKIRKTCSTALEKNFPVVVSITKWLHTGDLASSQLQHQSEFRDQLSRALESWKAWPSDPQAPLHYPDVLILTFMDIFFKNLDEGITTIYDPTTKTLIVEESKKHLLIRSFGPRDYVLVVAQNEGDAPLTFEWFSYGSERLELGPETLEVLIGAMKSFGHKVSGEEPVFLGQYGARYDSHTLSLQVAVDTGTFMALDWIRAVYSVGSRVLVQDLATAVVSSVIENEKIRLLKENLIRATGRSGLMPGGVDVNVITG